MAPFTFSRRSFLRQGSVGTTAMMMGGGALLMTACDPIDLLAADALGLKLPPFFTARVVATTGETVPGTSYVWHVAPDGGATFALPDGGWSYVSNSEWVPPTGGGVGYIRFDSAGAIVDAGVSLSGSVSFVNCAGGATPWGTWLSCEEIPNIGRVFECDPVGASPAVERPLMGRFKHEAAAADSTNEVIYLTEDEGDSALYRFVPDTWGDLSAGVLEVLTDPSGVLTWTAIPDPSGVAGQTKDQVADTVRFDGGEGCDMSGDTLLFTTKGDGRVWAYDTIANTLTVLFDPLVHGGPLHNVDNLVTSSAGVAYVAEDGDDLQIVLVRPDGSTFPVLQLCGAAGSELTGPAFDPLGTRLYFSSQRNPGQTFEVTGPWAAYTEPGPLELTDIDQALVASFLSES